jgi:hypothetical protein
VQCIICKRGPAWGIRLQAIGGDTLSCPEDVEKAVNLIVGTVGVQGIVWPYRRFVRRQLRAVAC